MNELQNLIEIVVPVNLPGSSQTENHPDAPLGESIIEIQINSKIKVKRDDMSREIESAIKVVILLSQRFSKFLINTKFSL